MKNSSSEDDAVETTTTTNTAKADQDVSSVVVHEMTTTKKDEKATSKEDEGLTIKIRKFDSGQAWEEKLREEEEENEKSEWPVDSASYEFSQKRSIAKGSFGRVYIATCPSKSSKLLAIKIIQTSKIDVEDMKKEVDTMIMCRHPNIIPLYSCFVVKSKLWFVMPFMKMGSISHILKTLRNIGNIWGFHKEEWIQAILTMSLRGIEYLHKSGRIHRDIKSGNILLDENGTALVADMGLVTLADRMGRGESRQAGTICYFPPEMVLRRASSLKTDVWAIGIFALELARSYPPYMDQKVSNAQILSMIAMNPSPTLEYYDEKGVPENTTRTKFSKTFEKFVARALEKDPNRRVSATELLKDPFLKRFTSSSATPPSDILRNDFLPMLSKLEDSLIKRPPMLRESSSSSSTPPTLTGQSTSSGVLDSKILKGFVDPSKSRGDKMFTIAKKAVEQKRRRESNTSKAVTDKFKKVFESDGEGSVDENAETLTEVGTTSLGDKKKKKNCSSEGNASPRTITERLARAFSDDDKDN